MGVGIRVLPSRDVPRPSTFLVEFAHTQLHSARARAMTDRVNGKGWVPRLTMDRLTTNAGKGESDMRNHVV